MAQQVTHTVIAVAVAVVALAATAYLAFRLHSVEAKVASGTLVGTSGKTGLFHLHEFDELHPELKALWYDNFTIKVMPAMLRKVSEAWVRLSVAERDSIKVAAAELSDKAVKSIESLPAPTDMPWNSLIRQTTIATMAPLRATSAAPAAR